MKEIVLEDTQLGIIVFKHNPRAKRYIIRVKTEIINVTIPIGGNYEFAERFFRGNRTKIIKQKELLIDRQNNSPIADDITLKQRALGYLPGKLQQLAKEHGFKYKGLRINKSRTRWGSCSSRTTINLSFYLMLLPEYLIEYVLLHELCHTVEMNHGPAFWELMDKHTCGRAKQLRKELKLYSNYGAHKP